MNKLYSVLWGRQIITNTAAIQTFYLARWLRSPDEEELQLLAWLLDASTIEPEDGLDYVYIGPRSGTVSMWSSQATTIASNCGVKSLRRIERGSRHKAESFAHSDHFGWYNYDPLIHHKADTINNIMVTVFARAEPAPDECVIKLEDHDQVSIQDIKNTNDYFNLGLDSRKIEWIAAHYNADKSTPVSPASRHQPTITELMTFAQFHSEHCRHNTFRASWQQDGKLLPAMLDMIRSTTTDCGNQVLSAYKDNSAVTRSYQRNGFYPDDSGVYRYHQSAMHTLMKVETHNHPTAICPEPGAATGAGGELRDEAATGRGAKPVAGMVGYCTSNLQPTYDDNSGDAPPLAAALTIICHAPLGAADYNNEFGRPALCGYFRTYEQCSEDGTRYGYYKPIMIAGGHGCIAEDMIHKRPVEPGQLLLLMGGPALRVGIGGGSASSGHSGRLSEELDIASVQRAHAEIQRRCQEVINTCWQLGDNNPILSIHDVGAGGVANAIPEILDQHGININIARIEVADRTMNALERWCNESQERFVFTINPKHRDTMMALCARERVSCKVLGIVSDDAILWLRGSYQSGEDIETACYIDTSMRWLHTPVPEPARQMLPTAATAAVELPLPQHDTGKLIEQVLQAPTVADKSFLITIGDRSVGGLTAHEQLAGPWQVAVNDCAVSAHNYDAFTGTAMAVGERPPIAVTDAAASVRMAIAEAITNICAARVLRLEDITLSANWMAAAGEASHESELFEAVAAACQLCRQLGIAIPVGKDSLAMRARWQTTDNIQHEVISPLSLVVTAFAQVADIRDTLSPQICPDQPLLLLESNHGLNRLGGSIMRQVCDHICKRESVPDCDGNTIRAIFEVIQTLNDGGHILAYHDRSDGGLVACLCEMAFAGHCGLTIDLPPQQQLLPQLFSEELGAVVQVSQQSCDQVLQLCQQVGLRATVIAQASSDEEIKIRHNNETIYSNSLPRLRAMWSDTHKQVRAQRGDDTACIKSEYLAMQQQEPVLFSSLPDYQAKKPDSYNSRPRLAVLREQGVNGHVEMAAAFDMAGFSCHDVHMSDLVEGRCKLEEYQVLAVPGGFSYGDVLGAGRGWAASILCQPQLRDQFAAFFSRSDTLTLGLCNGCQMLTALWELIPGSNDWKGLDKNSSGRFEGRTVMVSVTPSPSVFLAGMHNWQLPVPVAHGEGRFSNDSINNQCLHYIDATGQPTMQYPANPAGSAAGIAGLCNDDGRVTMLMPHPERAFRNWQLSWHPPDWRGNESPWMQIFHNARTWIAANS